MNPPENEFDLPQPEPQFDLEAQKPLPPIDQAQKQRNRLMGAMLFLLLAFLVVMGQRGRDDPAIERMNRRAEKLTNAIEETKQALYERAHPTRRKNMAENEYLGYSFYKADGLWKELTQRQDLFPNDLRRYALFRAEFRYVKPQETLALLKRAASLSLPALPKNLNISKAMREEYEKKPALSSTQEIALWEAIFGEKPLSFGEAMRVRDTLPLLDLHWFERLARIQLYRKANRPLEAQGEITDALRSVNVLVGTTSAQRYLFLWGLFSWVLVLVRKWVQARERRNLNAPSSPVPALAPLTEIPFSYSSRTKTFAVYLAFPIVFSLFISRLRPAFESLTAVEMLRVSFLIEALFTLFTIGITLHLLKRGHEREGGGHISLLAVWRSLLGDTRRIGTEMAFGVLFYARTLILVALAAALSNILFKNFETPPHPNLFTIAYAQTPLDYALMFLKVSLGAAVTEELLFRGVLFPAMRERWGIWGGIALSSAVFAILHPTLPAGFLPLWTLGASFAFAYQSRRSLIPGMTMHALNNGLIIASQLAVFAR